MKKIILTDEIARDLQIIGDAAERNLSTRVFYPIWERIIKQIVEEDEQDNS